MGEKLPIVADGAVPTPSGIKVIVVGAGQFSLVYHLGRIEILIKFMI